MDSFVTAPAGLQRARGRVGVHFKYRDGDTVLDRLHQQGCLKARLPRTVDAGWCEVISLNNSGGVAGGDDLSTSLYVPAGCSALYGTASAERIYRSAAGDKAAMLQNHLELGQAACGEWLPQETILFDGSQLHRTLDIEMAESASLLCVETLIFGRVAMGECLTHVELRDRIRVRRERRLILQESLRPPSDMAAGLDGRGMLGAARASTTLIFAAPDASDFLDRARATLAEHPALYAGASSWDGMLVVRALAENPALLRLGIVALLRLLRGGRMLPRVWNC